MMLLLFFLAAGLMIGVLRGGGLSGLVGMRLKGVWLVLLSAAAELSVILLPRFAPGLFPGILPVIQLARYLPLLLFVLLGARNWRICLAGLGLAMNFAVICANGWRMPVWQTVSMPGLADAVQRVMDGSIPEYMIVQGTGGVPLWFFADIIPILVGEVGFASIGDILLGAGVMLTVQHSMARYSVGRHVRGSLMNNMGVKQERSRRRNAPVPVAAMPQAAALQASPVQVSVGIDAALENKPVARIAHQTVFEPRKQPALAQEEQPALAHEEQLQTDVFAKKPPEDIGFLPLSGPFPAVRLENANPIRLSPRLQAIANLIEHNAVVADIGCDHGKLSAYLALCGTPRIIAVDVSAKSLAKTRLLVKELGLQGIVHARVGNGLKKLKPGDAGTIVIAGLGGPVIADILEKGCDVAFAAAKLVLQPMNAVGMVRRWLADNGFFICDEQLAQEEDRIYQILVASQGYDRNPPMSLFELEIGHLLIDNRHPLLPKLLENRIGTIDDILAEIADNATPKAEARRSELIELRGRCEEVLEWLAQ